MKELQTQKVENLIATWFPTPANKKFNSGLLAQCDTQIILSFGKGFLEVQSKLVYCINSYSCTIARIWLKITFYFYHCLITVNS